jgi:hypothetical protein
MLVSRVMLHAKGLYQLRLEQQKVLFCSHVAWKKPLTIAASIFTKDK